MADTLLGIAMVLGIGILAVVLLAWRDARRRRRQLEKRTPAPVRIVRIRDEAAFMVEQLQSVLERGPAGRAVWVGPVLGYYRRLAALANAPRPSADQALRLAEEAERYVRQKRLKGICVAQQARTLADVVQGLEAD